MYRLSKQLGSSAAHVIARLTLLLCVALTTPAFSQSSDAADLDADRALQTLATAFAKKDSNAIRKLVNDGWSGLRFCANWSDGQWQAAAKALRDAKLQSSRENVRVYRVTIQWPGVPAESAKLITMNLQDSGWKLDLNSFLGPFPHL